MMSRLARASRVGHRSDRGATAVLVAVSMLVLMGFVAVAIDSGLLFNDRRQQQSAADGGALAAVQYARTSFTSTYCTANTGSDEAYAVCRGAQEAIAVVNGTLPGRYDGVPSNTLADWSVCTDPNRPARFTRISVQTPCISFTHNFQEARVVLPGTDVATPFGGVIGIESARVGAYAHALLDSEQSADILPFAIGPTGAGSSQACLFAQDTANLSIDPCVGNASGNFGKLDLSIYGNGLLGTVQNCGNSAPQSKMAINLAIGADHILEETSESAGVVDEVANCPITSNPVDQVPVQTGNAAQGISNGLFYGIPVPNFEGRIMCKDGDGNEQPDKDSGGQCESGVWGPFPEALDNNPLWDYINPANQLSGGACHGSINNRAEMNACITAWKAVPSPSASLFTDDLRFAPRFAAVPILASDPSGGSGSYLIVSFDPVYLETIYMSCNANTCATVHSPGETGGGNCPSPITPTTSRCGVPGNGNPNAIEALTAHMLDLDMLPDSIAENFPGVQGTVVYNLSE